MSKHHSHSHQQKQTGNQYASRLLSRMMNERKPTGEHNKPITTSDAAQYSTEQPAQKEELVTDSKR